MTTHDTESLTELTSHITDLQSRVAFQDDQILALTKRITEQDQVLYELRIQLKHLNSKFFESDDYHNSGNERPPHY